MRRNLLALGHSPIVLLALKEVLETDNDSVYKSVESAHIDTSTTT